jgi:hypothetical protein
VLDLVGRFGQMRDMMAALGGGGLLSRIPGLGRLAGAGAAPGGLDPAALLAPPEGGSRAVRRADEARRRSQAKRKRKQAKQARRKGRRK